MFERGFVYDFHFHPQGIANKYPDFKSDHALALLLMRGDMTRAEARQVVMFTITYLLKNTSYFLVSLGLIHCHFLQCWEGGDHCYGYGFLSSTL